MSEQNPKRGISRRQFLRLSVMVGAGAGLAACGGGAATAPTTAPAQPTTAATAVPTPVPVPTTPPKATAVPTVASAKYQEAPMLADLVKAGKLPPVDQRLPKNPMVLTGTEGVGSYGGVIRRGFRGVSDRWGPTKLQNEGLTWYNSDLSVRTNIIESWEVSSDATQWTFQLREGMKWSDGSEFTTADWQWWYENVLRNETLTKSPPGQWSTGTPRVLMTAEFPDPYVVTFTFANPKPLFAYTVTRELPYAHGEFMKQFHVDFADKAKLDEAVKAAKFETWDQLFLDRNNWWIVGRPSTGVWVATNGLDQEQFVMERNAYFWQVDKDGNQLPYIDTVNHLLFENNDAFNTRIVAGEVDFQARHVSIGDFTLHKENEGRGEYQVVLGVTANHVAFQPNHTTKNPLLREFFQSRDVRVALSLAINRDDINELAFSGAAVPRHSPLSKSPQYYEKLSTAYIQYDPAKANEMLDAAGYDKKNADGIRMWKDGSGPISFVVEYTDAIGSPTDDAIQTMAKYFTDVGVQATPKNLERSLYTEHFNANEIEAAFWGGDRTLLPIVAPWIFLGSMVDRPWGVAWGLHYNNAKDPNAEAPPEGHFITKIWDIMAQIDVEPDDVKRNDLFKQVLDIWAEELPMIGILGELPAPAIVKKGLMGFPAGTPIDDTTEDENLPNTQTYFWKS